ncbi:MAG: heavy metal translocating P-type ATPase [Paracoccaceae bacterium]
MPRDLVPPAGGCCPAGDAVALSLNAGSLGNAGDAAPALGRFVEPEGAGRARLDLMVPSIHCAACLGAIERGVGALDGVASARVHLGLRRLSVLFDPARLAPEAILSALDGLGHEGRPYDAAALAGIERDEVGRDLLARLGVAGFATMNVMLMSVAVWAGAEDATRDLLHWVSALVALPAIAFAGQPFFRSGSRALAAGRLTMDVPISLAVLLAAGVSLYETAISGHHAYFDAGISLVFFLLIGRYLDHRTRARARSAAAELSALAARSATLVRADGTRVGMAIEDVAPGYRLAVAPGERVPADGTVVAGRSDLDRSMVTGESVPEAIGPGSAVHAGMTNLSGAIEIAGTATGEGTVLAEIARLVEAAERGRTRMEAWADAAARHYAWSVHAVAMLALAGWLVATGGDVHASITIAAAVLIITCPCALGLAVPAVHTVASGRLFRRGILLKDGRALEALTGIDTVVFDKTGTLTTGRPRLVDDGRADDLAWSVAAALARASSHPLARALAEAAQTRGVVPAAIEDAREVPGAGVEAVFAGDPVKLGRPDWVKPAGGCADCKNKGCVGAIWAGLLAVDERSGVALRIGKAEPVAFAFEDELREDAAETVAALKARGLSVTLLSGDAEGAVARAAKAAGIDDWRSGMRPEAKLAALDALAAGGRRVLMVGDGINDAPALAAAAASMSPVAAADVSRAAAGLVFTGARLGAVVEAIDTAATAAARARQNFAMAAIYNLVAVPVALAGFVTPLVAALAMSGSSIAVMANALRGGGRAPENAPTPGKDIA